MTFTLRNPFNGKVRRPTQDEYAQIRSHIPECTGYLICGPILVLQCPTPPTRTPLTVGGLPTVFVPDLREYDDLGGLPGNPAFPNFGGSDFYVDDGMYPSFTLVESALKTLQGKLPNVVRLSWRYSHWVVGLSSSYFDPDSYPGKFGNKTVVYTWPGQSTPHSRRLTPFTSMNGDNSDYRAFGLSPGIKVVGHWQKATSSGVVVRNGHLKRLTLAYHGFLDTDDVHHPDPLPQWKIGAIDITFPWLDVALCRLAENVKYSNNTYFTANPPKRLVSSSFMDTRIRTGTWFEAEGFTSGRVHLFYRGPAVGFAHMPSYMKDAHRFTERQPRQAEMEYMGPEVGDMQEGLCGAPVVHEASTDEEVNGIVPGFAWLKCGRDLIVASVDDVIDEGWEIDDM